MQKVSQIVPIVTVEQLAGIKEFYQRHFGFAVSFEHEGYLALRASDGSEIAFMPHQCDGDTQFNGKGLTYCFKVADVDAEHARLQGEGLQAVRPLQDNPWGDRSFVVLDPVGISLYLYQEIPPTGEFAQAQHQE